MSFSDHRPPRHRSRLSHADVKLILFLIVQIKPFKYVGDRTLSQSRKWDLIQQKLAHHKLRAGLPPTVVPTVRTLQRQMATALRKAQHRHEPESYRPFLVFSNLTRSSPLADLELAVLELYNLSEAYKTGQTVGPLPDAVHNINDVSRLPSDSEEIHEMTRHSSDVSYQSQNLYGSVDLGEQDGGDVPDSVAPILDRIRMMVDENRSFHSECMSMLRQHAMAMHERITKLERMVLAQARDEPEIKKEEVAGEGEIVPSITECDTVSGVDPEIAVKTPPSGDRMLRSILQLLN